MASTRYEFKIFQGYRFGIGEFAARIDHEKRPSGYQSVPFMPFLETQTSDGWEFLSSHLAAEAGEVVMMVLMRRAVKPERLSDIIA